MLMLRSDIAIGSFPGIELTLRLYFPNLSSLRLIRVTSGYVSDTTGNFLFRVIIMAMWMRPRFPQDGVWMDATSRILKDQETLCKLKTPAGSRYLGASSSPGTRIRTSDYLYALQTRPSCIIRYHGERDRLQMTVARAYRSSNTARRMQDVLVFKLLTRYTKFSQISAYTQAKQF
ncbi:hypothetical protein OE88DRAFT_1514484 [Heliocybe sulcata]|uniref:Uncharacterized protein n=1 Tax=Heliocybe sulcata TaxID=5364 RepID=A0A5C3N0S6_9AGAM|nr:hypothetical protein OE88DRAFT_1514484 [Heliocybe sulcata]